MPQESESSAISLADFVGQTFDGPFSGSSSETETPQDGTDGSTTGAPPAESSPSPDTTSSDSEGEIDAGDPSAALAADPAAPPDDAASPDEDPFAGSTALTYVVNGETRTFDDIKVLKDYGAVIPLDALAKVQQRLSERDHLYERSQQQHQQSQVFDKLTQWTTKDQTGKEITLTGREAIQALRVEHAEKTAALSELVGAFKGPPADYLILDKDGNLAWNDAMLEHLSLRAQLSERNAADQVRAQFQGMQAELSKPADIDVVQSAPTLVDHFATQLNVTLTPDDKTFLATMLPRFVRPTTPEDIAANPALASEPRVIDAAFGQLMQREVEKRASLASSVSQASTVAKENAAKLMQAARGVGAKTNPAVRNTRPQPRPDSSRAQDAGNLFSMMESAANGRFHPSVGA